MEILGPSEAALGEEIEYIVKYKNNGNFRLENPELVFEPAENSIRDGKIFEREIIGAEKLGEAIYPGQEQAFSFKMRLLGKEGDAKLSRAVVIYQPKNLKAKYNSETSFTTVLKSVPLTLDFDLPTKIDPGKNFTFRINYFSNVDYTLSDLRLQIEYPLGFEFISSAPKALEKVEWPIAVLNKSRGGRIEVSGKLSGELGEAKVFRAKLGLWQNGEFILLKEAERGIEITKPSLYIRQEINDNPQYVAQPGDWLHYEIFFKNVGEDALDNLFLVNKLDGDAFDFSTLRSDFGNFQSGDNSVVFDWRKVFRLQYLAPTEEGRVEFWVKLKDDLGSVQNPIIKNKIFISQIEEEFANKISSKLEISQTGFFQDEVFGNQGPIPPRSGQTTTYTISWQAKNYYSDVRNVKVKALLPQGVELTGRIFPDTEGSKFSFDSQSREIVWSLGDLARGRGVFDPGPGIAFQVAFTPNFSQNNQLVGQANITGEDSWGGNIVSAVAPALSVADIVQ